MAFQKPESPGQYLKRGGGGGQRERQRASLVRDALAAALQLTQPAQLARLGELQSYCQSIHAHVWLPPFSGKFCLQLLGGAHSLLGADANLPCAFEICPDLSCHRLRRQPKGQKVVWLFCGPSLERAGSLCRARLCNSRHC